MQIIDRYVYAVISKLPQKSTSEVSKEVKSLIYDMMESYDDNLTEEEKARKTIDELGNPEVLANNYRGNEKYLIGPKYFYKYVFVLKIVLLAVFLGVSVATLLGIFSTDQSITDNITKYITVVFNALLQGASWVTIVFIIIENKNVNLDNESTWSINDLPQVPNKKALISRGESIFTIIFATIFFSLVYFVPQLIGVYYKNGSTMVNIPVFNVDGLNNYKIIIILALLVLIIHESIKIIWGRWTTKRAVASSVISVISSILTIIFFKSPNIWNNEISEIIYKYTGFELILVVNIIVLIIIFVTLLEIGTTLYKGLRYGKE